MRYAYLMLSLLLAACAVLDTRQVESQLCTIEDQDAGLCPGPFATPEAAAEAAASDQGIEDVDKVKCNSAGYKKYSCFVNFSGPFGGSYWFFCNIDCSVWNSGNMDSHCEVTYCSPIQAGYCSC